MREEVKRIRDKFGTGEGESERVRWPRFRVAELVCSGGFRRRELDGWCVPKQTKSAHMGAETKWADFVSDAPQ